MNKLAQIYASATALASAIGGKVAKGADVATTVIGVAAATAVAQGIDLNKLATGDPEERNKAIIAAAIGGLGWLSNKAKK